jgi:hypothetical protein
MSTSVETPQDHQAVATLVIAATGQPPNPPSPQRRDRLRERIQRDPAWRED